MTDLFNAASEGLVIYDRETAEILSVNRRLLQLFGYDESKWEAENFSFGLAGIDKSELLRIISVAVQQAPCQFAELASRDCAGRPLFLEIGVAPVAIDGQTRCFVSMRDITARKQMEAGLEYLRQRDPLTGVYNRAYFEAALVRARSCKSGPMGIFVCDVDGLKLINDTLGHPNGDELLKRVASVLTDEIKAPDYVARVGGDEFAVVLYNATMTQMEALDHRYRVLVERYNAEHPQLPLRLSLGWSWRDGEDQESTMEALFKIADNFMYRQKMHQRHSVRGSIVRTLMQALEERDRITEGHAARLSSLMEKMGQRLAMPKEVVSDLRLLAKFHDIGKVGIPDNILKKPGRLTSDEVAIMRQHCEIGFRIAKSSPDLEPIADWILKHHEHWNGKGYPLGLRQEEIPIQCRILGIVDAYDAMTGERPYQKALTREAAIEEIRRCAGTQFDPSLTAVFIALLSEPDQAETDESA